VTEDHAERRLITAMFIDIVGSNEPTSSPRARSSALRRTA
jgi:hypothetical protein